VIPGEVYFSGNRLEPIHVGEAELGGLTGKYYSDELEATYMLSAEKGKLTVRVGDSPPIMFDPATHDEFYSADFRTLVFQSEGERRTTGFKLFTQSARGIVFNRVN